jgi:hypothetical protein
MTPFQINKLLDCLINCRIHSIQCLLTLKFTHSRNQVLTSCLMPVSIQKTIHSLFPHQLSASLFSSRNLWLAHAVSRLQFSVLASEVISGRLKCTCSQFSWCPLLRQGFCYEWDVSWRVPLPTATLGGARLWICAPVPSSSCIIHNTNCDSNSLTILLRIPLVTLDQIRVTSLFGIQNDVCSPQTSVKVPLISSHPTRIPK